MVQHFVAAAPTEVEVDVGAVTPCWVQKTLEHQLVPQRICIREAQAIGRQAVRRRTASYAGNVALARKGCDGLHQQEVRGVAERVDGRQLVIKSTHDLGLERAIALRRTCERHRGQS